MATNHAGGRTGRVEKNALKRLAIPPLIGRPGIGGHELGLQLQAVKVFLYAQ